MIFPLRFICFSLIIFSFGQAFGEKRTECSSNVTHNGFADVLGQMPHYFVDVTFTTKNGEQTLSYEPCKKGKWDPADLTWCEDGNRAQMMNSIKQTEVAPGIYAYKVKFSLKPENATIDPFCAQVYDSIVITDYANQKDDRSFLVSAYKGEVLGILFVSFNDNDAVIFFFQGPCDAWNNLVNGTMYKGQGLYPECVNYIK